MNTFVGIDVAKASLDIAASDGTSWSAPNQLEDMASLVQALTSLAPKRIVLEATGGYEKLALQHLLEANLPVVRVNPRQARDFARATGLLAKTDRLDAQLLARYAQIIEPKASPPCLENEEFAGLVARRRQLVEMRTQEKNRFKQTRISQLQEQIQAHLEWLDSEIETLQKEIDLVLKRIPLSEPLQTIPGVGTILTSTLLAELPELGTLSRKEVAALAGLAPFNRDSGKWTGQRCVWGGRASIRAALYMPTLAAIRFYPPLKSFYQRLKEAGKPFKVAITACMRKLLTILNAIAKQHRLASA